MSRPEGDASTNQHIYPESTSFPPERRGEEAVSADLQWWNSSPRWCDEQPQSSGVGWSFRRAARPTAVGGETDMKL